MARLPTPGSDDGAWGQLLNDFLLVSHDGGGAIKADAVDASALQDSSVAAANLKTGSGSDGQVLTKDAASSGGLKWSPVTAGSPATAGSLGTVQLSGDLGGTATAPTVPGLAGKVSASRNITAGTGLTGGGDLTTDRTLSVVYGTTANTAAAGNHTHTFTFSLTSFFKTGALTTTIGTQRLPIDGTYTIVGTRIMVGTAPTGADIIIDVNKNGSSIYTAQANRPTIIATQNAGGPGIAPNVTSLAAGDYMTVDIDQVGSTVAGADLTVSVVVSKVI